MSAFFSTLTCHKNLNSMYRNLVALVALFGFTFSSYTLAQTPSNINVKVDGLGSDTVYLAHYYGAKLFYNDTTLSDAEGNFSFKGKPRSWLEKAFCHPWKTWLRVSWRETSCVCGWLLLARVPPLLQATPEKRRVLGQENWGQPAQRPKKQQAAQEERLEGSKGLGMQAEKARGSNCANLEDVILCKKIK